MFKKLRFKSFAVFSLLLSAVMSLALMAPGEAEASVAAVNTWPVTPQVVSNGSAATASGTVTIGAGSNRVMLVSVGFEYSATPGSVPLTVKYGSKTVKPITQINSAPLGVWIGYLKEADIAAVGSGGTLSVTNGNTTNLSAMYAAAAIYSGVEQTFAPFSGFATNATSSANNLSLSAYAAAGPAGNTGASIYLTAWNGKTTTASAGYTERMDYAGTNFNFAADEKLALTPTGTEAPTSAPGGASVAAAMVGVSLTPSGVASKIVECSNCHGNPPVDGTARNNPAGTFLGSHNKHSGTDSATNQLSLACSACHYDHSTTTHSSGFKNITGSSLPGNAYSQGKKIAISNSPTLGTCSVNCHSTGRTPTQYAAPAWGGTTTCLSCHGGRNGATGAPARSSANFTMSTTHSQHLKYSAVTTIMNCEVCHAKTATNAATLKSYTGLIYHANGTPNVLFSNIAYASYTSYKVGTKKCSNTACHGGTTRSAWTNSGAINTNNTCTHCHGLPSGVSAAVANAEPNRRVFAPGWGGTGTSTDGNSANSDVRVGAHFVHLSSVYIKRIKCNECHTVPSNPFDGTHMATVRFQDQCMVLASKACVAPHDCCGA